MIRPDKTIGFIIALFILLSGAYSVVNPLHEATDELRHYRFVRHIIQRGALPVQGEVGCSAQGHHPPLFYGLSAVATGWIDTGRDVCYEPPTNPFWNYRYWEVGVDNKNQYLHGVDETFPWQGEALAAHLTRFINVLMGALTVYLTWCIGRVLWPDRPAWAVGGTAFVAFNPMFVYMAGAINNDVIASVTGTAVLLACLHLLKDPKGLSVRWGVILGMLYGLALMSKFNLAAVAVLIALSATWVAWHKKQWRGWWGVGLTSLGVALLIAGWWFVRNQMLYGEPTGFQRLTELWGVRDPRESFGVAIFELDYAWTSLWGRFGYGQIPLPEFVYTVLRWFVGLSLVGLVIPLWHKPSERFPLLLLVVDVLLFFAVLFNYMLVSPAGPMGRFFFPALPALSILIFYGFYNGLTWSMAKVTKPINQESWGIAWMAHGGMVLLTMVALFGYLAPAYAHPPAFTEDEIPQEVDAQFAFARLRGYEVHQTAVSPADPIDIDLYWEVVGQPPGDFLLFVHLWDENGTMVVQRDTHTGLGNYPVGQWQEGEMFKDSIRLYVPETAYAPSTAQLSFGLYVAGEAGYRIGITDEAGNGLGDAFGLGEITITPITSEFPNNQQQNFNNEVVLRGYDYSARMIGAEPLAIDLYWEGGREGQTTYEIALDVVDERGVVVQTAVYPFPQNTATLAQGESLHTTHLVDFSTHSQGIYKIHVALLDVNSKQRQNIVGEDGHWINNHLPLSSIRVEK